MLSTYKSICSFCTRHGERNAARADFAPAPAHLTATAVYLLPYVCRNVLCSWRQSFDALLAGRDARYIGTCVRSGHRNLCLQSRK
jgi:hypothetical protein